MENETQTNIAEFEKKKFEHTKAAKEAAFNMAKLGDDHNSEAKAEFDIEMAKAKTLEWAIETVRKNEPEWIGGC